MVSLQLPAGPLIKIATRTILANPHADATQISRRSLRRKKTAQRPHNWPNMTPRKRHTKKHTRKGNFGPKWCSEKVPSQPSAQTGRTEPNRTSRADRTDPETEPKHNPCASRPLIFPESSKIHVRSRTKGCETHAALHTACTEPRRTLNGKANHFKWLPQ